MVAVMRAVRHKLGPTVKIAFFLDNARIHVSQVTTTSAQESNLNIRLLRNLSYRPDLNGIEQYWGACKVLYRKKVDWHKAMGTPWN
jgi:transposase